MTVSSHKSKIGITGAVQAGSVDITDTDAVQSTVLTITLANGTVLTATEGTVATSTDVSAMTYTASTGSSGSKRTAAAVSLAGALNANGNLTATSASSVVTITEVYGGTGGSISFGGAGGMTVVDWSGGVDSGESVDRHTVAAGGTAGGFNSTANIKSILDLVKGVKTSGSKVITKTGTATKPGIEAATNLSGNIFAYNPNGRAITRSSTDTGFLLRGGTATKIAGAASTGHLISIPGSDTGQRNAGNLHASSGYRRKGTWATQVFDLLSGVLLQSDGTAKAGITDRGVLVEWAADQGHPTRAIPGELVILFNFASFTTNYVDYSAITG